MYNVKEWTGSTIQERKMRCVQTGSDLEFGILGIMYEWAIMYLHTLDVSKNLVISSDFLPRSAVSSDT